MSFGKPLLVSNAVAQEELVVKNKAGLVHKDRDLADFCDKILQLYTDENLRKELGENGKNFVRNNFTWEKTAKNLIELYNTLSV